MPQPQWWLENLSLLLMWWYRLSYLLLQKITLDSYETQSTHNISCWSAIIIQLFWHSRSQSKALASACWLSNKAQQTGTPIKPSTCWHLASALCSSKQPQHRRGFSSALHRKVIMGLRYYRSGVKQHGECKQLMVDQWSGMVPLGCECEHPWCVLWSTCVPVIIWLVATSWPAAIVWPSRAQWIWVGLSIQIKKRE